MVTLKDVSSEIRKIAEMWCGCLAGTLAATEYQRILEEVGFKDVDIEPVHAAHPEVKIFWYEADHGFNCTDRSSYNATAAKQARDRSLEFLKKHSAK